MKDPLDKKTQSLPLEPVKRGRGRPKTGQAMTPAEKQRAYRERKKAANKVTENGVVNGEKVTVNAVVNEAMDDLRKQLRLALLRIEQLDDENQTLKNELASRPEVTEKEPSTMKWIHEYKLRGSRKWERPKYQVTKSYGAYDTSEMKEHIDELNKNNKTARWRSVREDGMIYDPKSPK